MEHFEGKTQQNKKQNKTKQNKKNLTHLWDLTTK